ncbi:MAG: hypothetical protein R3A78_16700 [Polyangiales bacterium]|nr:hypothetical protein [Myxococcales bacterium]
MKNAMLLMGLALTLGAFGCDDDKDHDHTGDHHGAGPSCDAIIEACHEVDDGSNADVTECHETAHGANSEDECTPIKDACVALCEGVAQDGGNTTDGGDAG